MASVQSILPVLLLGLSVVLGLFLGYQFLQRRPNRPALIAFHILPALAALEVIALLLRATPDGTAPGKAAALLLIIALIVGVMTSLVARDRPRVVATVGLGAHALLGAAAFVLLLTWIV